MPVYRKKPVEIEAHRLTVFNMFWLEQWCGGSIVSPKADARYRSIVIPSLEGDMEAKVGDWIIKGIAGEFYPCRDDIFRATYEEAASGTHA